MRIPRLTRFRLFCGGLWKHNHPDLPDLRDILAVAIVVALLLIVQGLLDNRAHAVTLAEKRAEKAEHTVIECLNGIAIWKAADGSEVGCMPAQTN